MSNFQDWEPINIGNKSKSSAKVHPSPQIKATNNNTPEIITGDEKRIEKVDIELSKMIVKKRVEKGLNQSELAKALSLDVNIIKTYENGTALHNGMIVSKLKKYLGINKFNQ
jgi:ribosome-binding protein aMBF1 (putative translation factor)